MLLIPSRFIAVGAIISLGTMFVAIFSHLTKLGIEVQGDGGTLFFLAVVVFALSSVVLFLRREEIPIIGSKL